ncbi:hypothetical protein G7Z17_g3715 [Cylindrodendrum hubeiense]|uniref:Xylanolytic transcriptional activator regulatory domain-containing protein n=1 Tax=Cylindrodendrum hubeiense TaxID=595255 RepID=A0A9P5HHE0_9HYPO|nr:hypothetical protein G7Z17_g3715 [Cylindrodendrum hubeiense]
MDIPLRPNPIGLITPPWDAIKNSNRLQRQQQDVLLDLFWQGYHASHPVLDEASFRKHYNSLWESPSFRKPCPLVDSVLALCIQFGSTYTSFGDCNESTSNTPSTPGREFYLRAQCYLSQNLECQSLMTAQCYFLNAIYLLATNHVNSAHSMVGTAIRVAQSLGLHQEGSGGEPIEESGLGESRKRLWDCLVTLDIQLSIRLGRPFALPDLQSEHHGPYPDNRAEAVGPAYSLSPKSGINWLSFLYERRRLFGLVREIHDEFYAVCEDVLEEIDAPDFYQHAASREKCARFLFEQMKKLKNWAQELPEGLKTPRRNGMPFSVDRSPLDLSHCDPIWLQRQRLILEIEYHSCSIILRRPFISFLPTPALGTLTSDNHCIVTGNSAIAVTNILHQAMKDSDILTGCYQVVNWQQNAMFGLAGFACGYPICPLSPSVRRCMPTAAAVFELARAADKADLANSLKDKTSEILKDFGQKIGIPNLATIPSPRGSGNSTSTNAQSPVNPDLAMMEIGDRIVPGADGLFGIDAENMWTMDCPTGTLLWGDLMRDFGTELMPPIAE